MRIIFNSGWRGNRGVLSRGSSDHPGSVGEGEFITLAGSKASCVCICVCIYIYIYVYTNLDVYITPCVYMYVCICL